MKKVLLTATVQSHICQFHKPLVEMLREKGYVIHVAAKNNLEEKKGLKLDFVDKIFDVPFSRSPKSLDNFKAYKILKKIIEEEKYYIIHCNTPMGGIVTRLAAWKSRKMGTKVFYTAHGFHFYKGAPKINWIIYYPIEKIFSKITDQIITINHEDFELANKKFFCKTSYIHGVGVDNERYRPVTLEKKYDLKIELGLSHFSNIILCIGELLPNKNQRMIIEAMKNIVEEYPRCLLLLAGNGPMKDSLEKQVKNLKLEQNVIFLGYCTRLEQYQSVCDIVVSCSRREGLPLNIVEAMLSANPVVATKNRGHCELIDHGETGYLIDIDNVNELYYYIDILLSDNDKLSGIGNNAYHFAKSYSSGKVKKELEKIYFDILEGEVK